MRTIIASLVLAVSLGVTGVPRAQTDDRAYCERLFEIWERYISPLSRGQISGGRDALEAVNQCRQGDTSPGIAYLEKKVQDNRFTLPAR
jgi:hypothetical protein